MMINVFLESFFDRTENQAVGQLHPVNNHIVDQLIAERSNKISAHPMWPLLRPLALMLLQYKAAVAMADKISDLDGFAAFNHVSNSLDLDIAISGLDHIPEQGGFILAPNHPTGIADGLAVFNALRHIRPDMVFFANRDTLRVNSNFNDMVIPVEWRKNEKSRIKSRDTLARTARAFEQQRAVVLFPAGRIAHWHNGALTERPWQTSVVTLARKYNVPIIPLNITARNSALFYFLSRCSDELRDMTVFHELLNKKHAPFQMTFGTKILPSDLIGDAQVTANTLRSQTLGITNQPYKPWAPQSREFGYEYPIGVSSL